MVYTATYSPDDNKLRLYASQRLDADTYARVKAAGFRWAPKQDLFVAPAWSPERADLCVELAGQIDDDDQSLMDRAEERADRFTDYHAARTRDAEQAHKAVETIAQGIPLGQPILIGHHSERHARKDAERIESGMRRAVRAFETAEYWTRRAAGSLYHAKYKERPDVRARRIKTLEAEARKVERSKTEHNNLIRLWRQLDTVKRKDGAPTTQHDRARMIANVAGGYYSFPLADYPRAAPASQYEGAMSIWSALGETPAEAVITPEQARDLAITTAEAGLARCEEWIAHLSGRLAYERAMLADAGGTVADKTGPEKGGACRCWATDRGLNRWSTIQKVNQISVTVLDTWHNGGADFTRTIPFDKLTAMMSRADVEAARAAGRIIDETPRGFALLEVSPTPEPPTTTDTPAPVETLARQP